MVNNYLFVSFLRLNPRVTVGTSDLFDVKNELQPVTARWKPLGLALRLDPDKLDEIEKDNRDSSDCLTKVLTLWLKRNYITERFGEPSWELLASAVGHPSGGNDSALAERIANRYKIVVHFDYSIFTLIGIATAGDGEYNRDLLYFHELSIDVFVCFAVQANFCQFYPVFSFITLIITFSYFYKHKSFVLAVTVLFLDRDLLESFIGSSGGFGGHGSVSNAIAARETV